MTAPAAPIRLTPAIRAMLRGMRRRIRCYVWVSGLAVALALAGMALAGEVGLEVSSGADTPLADTAGGWFGESAGRMVVAVASEHLNDVLDRAETVGIATVVLGESGGSNLRLGTTVTVDLDALRDNWRDRLPGALSSGNLAE